MDTIITLVCLIGIICALITISLNINLVIRIVLKKSKRKDEMHLFYYRFALDIIFGICLLSYIIFIILSIEYPDFMREYRDLIVYLALPWSNFAACRSIISLAISTERVFAAYFPLNYRAGSIRIPNWSILILAMAFGLSEEIILFQLCDYNMIIPSSCRVFGCAVNRCFYLFWTIHKTCIFCVIVLMSILLSVELFIWNNLKHDRANSQLSKANRLALLDTVTVLIFDFLPSFCGSMWPTAIFFSFDYVGPYNAVGKVTGCAIESIVVTTVLFFRTSKCQEVSSIRRRNTLKQSSKTSKSNRPIGS
uniref:Serpentine Receptor, class BC (Class B-like) n=1 Tax=Caenorhabditis tropicalis TaxID=1561998 RepID=A0A1I7V1U4_9PELO